MRFIDIRRSFASARAHRHSTIHYPRMRHFLLFSMLVLTVFFVLKLAHARSRNQTATTKENREKKKTICLLPNGRECACVSGLFFKWFDVVSGCSIDSLHVHSLARAHSHTEIRDASSSNSPLEFVVFLFWMKTDIFCEGINKNRKQGKHKQTTANHTHRIQNALSAMRKFW